MIRAFSWASMALLLILTACGGGGGSPTTPDPPDPPPSGGLTYTPDSVSGARTLTLRRQGSGNDRLVLELFASQVTDLYGVAFDLRYPTNLLRLGGVVEASFLSANDAVDTTLQMAEAPAGNLVVGFTRVGRVGGVSGSGVLLTLEFEPIGPGTGALSFSSNEILDPSANPIPGFTWGAGSVSNN
jgi:hypothetical protein